jgi:phosphatidylinositol alpha 1,6-mannosyltransferase
MRVALITETFLPDVNGVATTLCRLLEHLQRSGDEALVFAPMDAPASYAGAEIVPLHGVPLPMYPELKLTPPQPGITPLLRRFKPDLVHLAGPAMLGPTGRYVARILRWVHNSCALTLCPSLATLADLRAHGFRRLRLWRRGVDTARFHPCYRSLAWRESVGVQPGETLLLYTGRLAMEKRLDLLADAIDGLERRSYGTNAT